MEGKHIRVDRVGSASSNDPKRSVFLGNVPFDIKDDEVGRKVERFTAEVSLAPHIPQRVHFYICAYLYMLCR